MNQEKNLTEIKEILIKRGNELLNEKKVDLVRFTDNIESDKLMNDFENTPHAYVLACVMDRQIKAERAWQIPYRISTLIGSFKFSDLQKLSLDKLKEYFNNNSLHRFNETMAENFYETIQLIHKKYDGDAVNIWKDNPKSATIVRRFLEFKGIGIKIATMATNILARDFKIPMQDHLCIDISPDVQVRRVFWRIGFIDKDSNNDELIYCARELYPGYPGIFDLSAWEIGRNWCRPKNPQCEKCYLNNNCQKNLE
ncbi:MAG: iron-sulfur cluster loop [Desulfobacula sp.]|jgi:endonuclease III|nr:iron-sulfur cluster loop [Desulfobacula sp.]